MPILIYGPYRISKGRAAQDDLPEKFLKRSSTNRRVAAAKLKAEITELEEFIKFLKRWGKLVDKGKVL